MKAWLKRWVSESDRGARWLRPAVRLYRWWRRGGWRPAQSAIARQFQQTFGYPLDWSCPRTLNEKLNWMKLHVRDPRQRIVADKYAVRAWVQARLGAEPLIPLLAVHTRAEELDWEALPAAFVLKVNHGSGQNWIVTDKSREDQRRIRRTLREWLATSHYALSREWPYRGIPPRLLVEKLLLDEDGQIPADYKIHCFGGRGELIQVDLDRQTNHRRNFYDPDWRLQPFVWTEWEGNIPKWPNGRPVPRPPHLPDMLRMAETLAADFPWYVRVDLLYCRQKVYFGEITFYHGGGFERLDPPEYDRFWGDRIPWPPPTGRKPPP